MPISRPNSSGVGSPADTRSASGRGATILLMVSIMCTGMRMCAPDRRCFGDRLPDPPGRLRSETCSPAVFDLVDRFSADIAFLDQDRECRPRLVISWRSKSPAQIGFDHFLLGLARLRSPFARRARSFGIRRSSTGQGASAGSRHAAPDAVLFVMDEILPTLARVSRPGEPARIELGAC